MPQVLPQVSKSGLLVNKQQNTDSPPWQLAFLLPASPDTKVNMHYTNYANAAVLLLSCSGPAASTSAASLGSFVYALPNMSNPSSQPLSTSLYARPASVDFMTRLAKVLARRLGKPTYVGGHIEFWNQEDEGVALRGVLDIVTKAVGRNIE